MKRSWTTGWWAVIAAALCAVGMAGCASVPSSGIDPSGEHFFAPPPSPPPANANANLSDLRYFDDPMDRLPWDDVAVVIEPRNRRAPVGTEVDSHRGRRRTRRIPPHQSPARMVDRAGRRGAVRGRRARRHDRPPVGRLQLAANRQCRLRCRQHLAEQRPAESRRAARRRTTNSCSAAKAGSRSPRRWKAQAM